MLATRPEGRNGYDKRGTVRCSRTSLSALAGVSRTDERFGFTHYDPLFGLLLPKNLESSQSLKSSVLYRTALESFTYAGPSICNRQRRIDANDSPVMRAMLRSFSSELSAFSSVPLCSFREAWCLPLSMEAKILLETFVSSR